jgi:hypothetical protein
MELEELVGEHILDAVDLSSENIKVEYGDWFEDCEIIRFRLDGVCYEAIANPEDGYRSSMREIRVSEKPMVNVFPGVRVLAKMKDRDTYQENDTLQLLDMKTGLVVLEAGTDNCNDYYPYFVSFFDPKAMCANAGKG